MGILEFFSINYMCKNEDRRWRTRRRRTSAWCKPRCRRRHERLKMVEQATGMPGQCTLSGAGTTHPRHETHMVATSTTTPNVRALVQDVQARLTPSACKHTEEKKHRGSIGCTTSVQCTMGPMRKHQHACTRLVARSFSTGQVERGVGETAFGRALGLCPNAQAHVWRVRPDPFL